MNTNIANIQKRIQSIQERIIHHPLYKNMKSIADIQVFMQHHVYAVWDFMSLLKSLQIKLTSVSVPWYPVGSGDTRYLINEIVAGEESDVDEQGVRKSHYEMYLEAMQQCKADIVPIKQFTNTLQEHGSFDQAYQKANVSEAIQKFVNFTFDTINSGKSHVISAVFTFGREDLIPNMFISIVRDLDERFPSEISKLRYYLERHIEVDGDHHSHLALEMTSALCEGQEEKWKEAEEYVVKALEMRVALWDAVLENLPKA